MPNGKPDHHPLTDICNHRIPYFDDDVDGLIRRIVDCGGESRIHDDVLKHDKDFGQTADLHKMKEHLTKVVAEFES